MIHEMIIHPQMNTLQNLYPGGKVVVDVALGAAPQVPGTPGGMLDQGTVRDLDQEQILPVAAEAIHHLDRVLTRDNHLMVSRALLYLHGDIPHIMVRGVVLIVSNGQLPDLGLQVLLNQRINGTPEI
jgi:hypothetical protein